MVETILKGDKEQHNNKQKKKKKQETKKTFFYSFIKEVLQLLNYKQFYKMFNCFFQKLLLCPFPVLAQSLFEVFVGAMINFGLGGKKKKSESEK